MNDKTVKEKQEGLQAGLLLARRIVFATAGRGNRLPHPLTS
jgi:hypothetical protein